MTAASLPDRVDRLEACTSEMADVLMGTPRSELSGGGRCENGIVHKVDRMGVNLANMEARLANGGIRARLSGRDRATLLAALVAAVGGIITALVAQ